MGRRPGDLRAEQAGTVRVVVLRGEHDVSTIRLLESALEGNGSGDGTVVDLTECGFIDSSSLAVLFHASQARRVGGFAVAVAPDTEVARLLDLVAFGKVVPVYPTREDAVRAINADE
jgi:anti-anti-sigma factor